MRFAPFCSVDATYYTRNCRGLQGVFRRAATVEKKMKLSEYCMLFGGKG